MCPLTAASRKEIRLRHVPRILGLLLFRSVASAFDHDAMNLGQSAAYSAIVALFPALIVAGAAVAFLPDTAPLRGQLSFLFDRILPPDVSPILQGYFVASPGTPHTARALIGAALVSLSGASGVIATLMEGLRRAHALPEDCWSFWQRRRRALLLVPLSLVPLAAASSLVVFGHLFTVWLSGHAPAPLRVLLFLVASLLRWIVALGGSVGLIGLLYAWGTPRRHSVRETLPGATVATAMWFLATLLFGWYVTRFANYGQVYGSLGAGIALLFWLYIICLCVLAGAEFNVAFHAHFRQAA